MFFTALLLMFALGSQVKVSEGNDEEDGAIAILQNELLAEKQHDMIVEHLLSAPNSEELHDDDTDHREHIMEHTGNQYMPNKITEGHQCKQYLDLCMASEEHDDDNHVAVCQMAYANCNHICKETGDPDACAFERLSVHQ